MGDGEGRRERKTGERCEAEGYMERAGEEGERQVGGRGRNGREDLGWGHSGALWVLEKHRYGAPGQGPWGPGRGSGGADLSGPPASLSAHCLPAALGLHLLTSACWILAPACCWLLPACLLPPPAGCTRL